MPVIAASEIHGLAATGDKQLKTALGQWLDNPPRRIDRLILQCLLAAAPLKSRVRSNCGLYLASAHPARATMGALLEAVCVQHKQPKPFEFVNSVSNAAGFHIAQQLGIDGPNLFIGAGEQVWPQLLSLANLDLQDGLIEQALLLLCDERGDFCVQAVLVEGTSEASGTCDFAGLCAAVEVQSLHL
ncbi:MAG: hypothetical protein Q7J43_11780 [Pseudomonas sp.]|uniref:hypothetical protein n=1 Tax=Pseudomonas sp. TaxID=306 RepID=UPI00271DD1F6|nr:hypothetical protein [Pseudomonas sp.]MDO9618348.1 hypothetical protein [Pseudomonas sp.]MDP2445967.1 hypothetical protein [Pseudomonas sp.]MDZ4333420.1 hypothetical protein [Pseudomonas sp.]